MPAVEGANECGIGERHLKGMDGAYRSNAIAQIRESIKNRELAIVAGTGVSLALTDTKIAALSWRGLIKNGLDLAHAKELIDDIQLARKKEDLNSQDTLELLLVAEFVANKLQNAPAKSLYASWFKNAFESVAPTNAAMIRALKALRNERVPIATLNYDSLIEKATKLPTLTLQNVLKTKAWMSRGKATGVLHLHGTWEEPAGCVLSIRDYTKAVDDEYRSVVQRNLAMFKHLLFIGCGDTFRDPNFESLVQWLRSHVKGPLPTQHYALVLDSDLGRRNADESWQGFVEPLSFGRLHSDLSRFLLGLLRRARKRNQATIARPTKAPSVIKEPKGYAGARGRARAPAASPKENPYAGLRFYDIGDEGHFSGRDEITARLISEIDKQLTASKHAPVVRIDGESGSGKSSLLRAGLVARLRKRKGVRIVVVTPADFRNNLGHVDNPVSALLRLVDSQSKGIRISQEDAQTVRDAGANAPRVAVELLRRLLKAADQGKVAGLIVFAFDQFEEIVDELSNPGLAPSWLPLMDFLEGCGHSKDFVFALTLESSRVDAYKACRFPRPFAAPTAETLDGFNREFLRQIICEPFQRAGFRLSAEVVNELIESTESLRRTEGAQSDSSSLLPLLSVKLQQVFQKVLSLRGVDSVTDTPDLKSEFTGSDPNEVTSEQIDGDTDIRGSIADLAQAAWLDTAETREVDENALHSYLRPLVRVASPDSSSIVLESMNIQVYSRDDRFLRSFQNRRLLVRTGNRVRLVHAAAIWHWPAAANWVRKLIPQLQTEARLRVQAEAAAGSKSRGRYTKLKSASEQARLIDDAAEILYSHRVHWATDIETAVPEQHRELRRWCLEILDGSTNPLRPVRGAAPEMAHIHLAAMFGRLPLLKRFEKLKRRLLDLPRSNGFRPLHLAAWGQLDTVRYLLRSREVNPVKPCKSGWRPIAFAIKSGRRDIFDELVRFHDPSTLDAPGLANLVHICAYMGQIEMARVLMDRYGISPDQPNENGETALDVAAKRNSAECLAFFVQRSELTKQQNADLSALHVAAQHGRDKNISVLLPMFAGREDEPTRSGRSPLTFAAENWRVQAVKILLPLSDPNRLIGEGKQTVLHLVLRAAQRRSGPLDIEACQQTLELLLSDPRTDPNIPDALGVTPLALAVDADQPALQRSILHCPRLNPDAPIRPGGETAIIVSIKAKDRIAFQDLCRRSSADISMLKDDSGNPVLHLLVKHGASEKFIIEAIESRGLELGALNTEGRTSLMVALDEQKWGIARALLAKRPDLPKVRGDKAQSAFGIGVSSLAPRDLWEPLWDREQSSLESVDEQRYTPLHVAMLTDNRPLIEWILQRSENPASLQKALDVWQRSPADLAPPANPTPLPPRSWDSCCRWVKVSPRIRTEIQSSPRILDARYQMISRATIEWSTLPFYAQKDARIVRVRDNHAGERVKLYFLYSKATGFLRLKGESDAIHYFNAKVARRIIASTVLDYLRFFCYFVRNRAFSFVLIESTEQREAPTNLKPEKREVLAKFVRPAVRNGWNAKAKLFYASAVIEYVRALYYCDFCISTSGDVKMIDDFQLAADLPPASITPLIVDA